MHIALVGFLEARPSDGPSLDRLRLELAQRLDGLPALRRKVRWTGWGEGVPCWEDDQTFDIAHHVLETRLPGPATTRNFLTFCAQRVLHPFDRARPLWRLELFPGLEGEQTGLLIVLHHAMADGLAGVRLMTRLLEAVQSPAQDTTPWQPQPVPTSLQLVLDNGLIFLKNMVATARGLLPFLRATWGALRNASTDLKGDAPQTSLSGPLGGSRGLVVIRRPLEALKAAGRPLGATLNDVLLASVAAGLRALLQSRGESVSQVFFRASVPVAVRGAGEPNQGGVMIVPLPLEPADPLEQLAQIAAATASRKQARSRGAGLTLNLPFVPQGVIRLWLRWLRKNGGRKVNLFVTNVPGPSRPLGLAGSRLTAAAPIAPLVAGVPIGIAALSYLDQVAISVHVDGRITDLEVLGQGMERALEILGAGPPAAG